VSSLADLDGDAEAISEAASFALITNALDGAIERYQSSIGNGTWMAARAAVGEALWWIASADEFLRFETEFPVHLLRNLMPDDSWAHSCLREIMPDTSWRDSWSIQLT